MRVDEITNFYGSLAVVVCVVCVCARAWCVCDTALQTPLPCLFSDSVNDEASW